MIAKREQDQEPTAAVRTAPGCEEVSPVVILFSRAAPSFFLQTPEIWRSLVPEAKDNLRVFRLSCFTPSAPVRQPGQKDQIQLLHEPAGVSRKILEFQSSNGCPKLSLSLADTENA